MKFVCLLIPLGFCLFYLSKAKHSPVYVCAFPMLICFGKSIFLPIEAIQIRVPMAPIALDRHDVGFLILLSVWFYIRNKRPKTIKIIFGLDVITVWVLLAYYVIQPIAIAVGQGYFYEATIVNNKTYYIFPLSVLVWVDLLRRFTRDEVWALLRSISLTTVLLSVPYILSGMGFKIYPYELYKIIGVGRGIIVRDFLTFPYWTALAFCYVLVVSFEKRNKKFYLICLGILGASSIVTLTRSLFLAGLGVSLFVLICQALRGSRRLLPVLVVSTSAFAIFFSVTLLMPRNFGYLTQRLEKAFELKMDEPNVAGRMNALVWASDIVDSVDPVFGLGTPGVRKENLDFLFFMTSSGFIQGDSMWFVLLMITGWAGLWLFVALLVVNLSGALKMSVSRNKALFETGLFVSAFLLWQTGYCFAGEGFYAWAFAATLPMAMAIIEKKRAWAVDPVTRRNVDFGLSFIHHLFFRNDQYAAWRRLAFWVLIIWGSCKIGLKLVR